MNGNALEDLVKPSDLTKKIVKIQNKRTCIDCGADISHLHLNTKRCKQCWALHTGKFEDKIKYIPNFIDDKIEGKDYVTCAICGFKTRSLQPHLHYQHGLKPKEYERMYNSKAMCEEEFNIRSNKYKGTNNPGYQHGGKLSPWSYKNTSKSKEEIEACRKKTIQSIQKTDKLNTKMNYWLNIANGNEEKAKELLSTRQATFSLEKCIQKYGEEEGQKRWKQRQDKWQATLDSKTDEEKLEINKKKLYKNGMISKGEKDLFDILKLSIPDIESQKYFSRDATHHYAYDICYKNKIIEYNGDYWHANPKCYTREQTITFPNDKHVLVQDIWDHDTEKINFAKTHGYEVLTIWESDYKQHREETINKCKSFLLN